MSLRAASLRRHRLRPSGCAKSRDRGKVSRDHHVADISSGCKLKRFATSSLSSRPQTRPIFNQQRRRHRRRRLFTNTRGRKRTSTSAGMASILGVHSFGDAESAKRTISSTRPVRPAFGRLRPACMGGIRPMLQSKSPWRGKAMIIDLHLNARHITAQS
jgi:hypothetical protein